MKAYHYLGLTLILAGASIVAIKIAEPHFTDSTKTEALEPTFTPEREPLFTSADLSNANRQIVNMQSLIADIDRNLDSIERNMDRSILKPSYSSNYMAPTNRISAWTVASNHWPLYFIQYTSNIYHQIGLGIPPEGITYHGSNGAVWDAKWIRRGE